MLAVYTLSVSFAPGASVLPGSRVVSRNAALSMEVKPVVIGVAADSGCGKSTFMRRLTSIFGGESKLLDIGRETNTLVSDMTTVICLDDYHKWDRTGRKSNPASLHRSLHALRDHSPERDDISFVSNLLDSQICPVDCVGLWQAPVKWTEVLVYMQHPFWI